MKDDRRQRQFKERRNRPRRTGFWQRRLVFDTITTRFFMLFIILLTVPLFTVFLLINSLVEDKQHELAIEQTSRTRQLLQSYLETISANEANLSNIIQVDRQFIDSCHESRKYPLNCYIIDIKTQQLSAISGRNNTPVSTQKITTSVLSSIKDLPVAFNAITSPFAIHNQTGQAVIRLSPNNKNLWVKFIPFSAEFINAFYHQYPHTKSVIWLASNISNKTIIQSDTLFFKDNLAEQISGIVTGKLNQSDKDSQTKITINEQNLQVTINTLSTYDGKPMGSFYIAVPLAWAFAPDDFYKGINNIILVSILLCVGLALIAAKPVTGPLIKLVSEVDTLSRSRLPNKRIDIEGVFEINQLKKAFNRLLGKIEAEQKMKDDFVATLTHDLKVPLIAEKQTLEYLHKGSYGHLNGEQQEVVETLASSNTQTLTMVQGLLEVYRYQSGEVKLNLEMFNLKKVLEETVQELQSTAKEKDIDLKIENPEESNSDIRYQVYGDQLEVKRGIQNLIANALTNTPRQGAITCELNDVESLGVDYIHQLTALENSTLRQPLILEGHVLLSIIDTGVGFDKEYLPEVFNQFGGKRGRNPLSIGLGLYNCYQVARAHNGWLWIESTESEGSAVTMMLPQNKEVYQDRRKIFERRS